MKLREGLKTSRRGPVGVIQGVCLVPASLAEAVRARKKATIIVKRAVLVAVFMITLLKKYLSS
jgi:hypothetical protein